MMNQIKRWVGHPVAQYPVWQSAFDEDALRRAWLSVAKNKGRAGSDGETLRQFERHLDANLHQLSQELLNRAYRPKPVTQILVPKPHDRWRPLTLWAIRDRVVQRAAYNYLEPHFEQRFLPCSYGFRSGLGTQQAAEAVYQAGKRGKTWVLDADIKDCFGQMRNGLLLKMLKRWRVPSPMVELIHYWLQARIWNAWRPEQDVAGTSQGGVISPLLCNLYLHTLDVTFMKQRELYLVRYADDFVVMGKQQKAVQQAEKLAYRSLKKIGLALHPQKTRLTSFDEGFQFVGWFFVRDEKYRLG